MKLTATEKEQLDVALANLKRCLLDELQQVSTIKEDKAQIDRKLLADDAFLAKIGDTYLSSTEGILGLLIASGLLSKTDCVCVAHCTMSTR